MGVYYIAFRPGNTARLAEILSTFSVFLTHNLNREVAGESCGIIGESGSRLKVQLCFITTADGVGTLVALSPFTKLC